MAAQLLFGWRSIVDANKHVRVHHQPPLVVFALSLALWGCGDEKDDFSSAGNRDGGHAGSSVGRDRPGTGSGSVARDAGTDLDADEADAGEPADRDAASEEPDAGREPTSDAAGPAGDAGQDAGRDADADGAVVHPDASSDQCAAPGEECESSDCCAGATCIIQPETGANICAAECAGPSECNSKCCVSVRNSEKGACVPAQYCEAAPVPMASGCGALQLIAEDGTFLGNAASSTLANDGVCNELSSYGGTLGAHSIYNELGTYGSTLSMQSAYNTLTTTPPALICHASNELVAFVTKNQFVTGAPLVDPDALCVVLANGGL